MFVYALEKINNFSSFRKILERIFEKNDFYLIFKEVIKGYFFFEKPK